MKFNSIDTIIEDIIDWGAYRGNIDRLAIKKFANQLLRKMEVPKQLMPKIALIPVDNFKGNLPEDYEMLVQAAFFHQPDVKISKYEIVEWTQKAYDGSKCEYTISKSCPDCSKPITECSCSEGEIIYDVDRQWELNHPELKYNHMKHYWRHGGLRGDSQVTSIYHPKFILMKPTTHNFFNLDSHIPGCLNLQKQLLQHASVEYRLNEHTIEVNREKGQVILSYLAAKVDQDGYRMIPDVEDVYEALRWYGIEMLHYRKSNMANNITEARFHDSRFKDAEQRRIAAMGRVNEIMNTPTYDEFMDAVEQSYNKFLKQDGPYDRMGAKTTDIFNERMNRLTDY